MKKNHLLSNTIRVCLSLLSLSIYSSGCAMASNLYPLPKSDVRVIGDKIYHNDKLFAELRYLFTDKEHRKHRGLAIYYYPYNKEVWIFPEKGWRIFEGDKEYYSLQEIEKAWQKKGIRGLFFNNKRADKGEAIYAWCFDVKISEDGKYVYYKTSGVFFASSHKYLVEYGVFK